jgi:hypothetical protein
MVLSFNPVNVAAFYIKQMDEMQTHYNTKLSDIKAGARGLQNSITAEEEEEEGQLQAIMFAMEKNFENYMTTFTSESNVKTEYDSNRV